MIGALDTPADRLRIEVFGAKCGGVIGEPSDRSVTADDCDLTAGECCAGSRPRHAAVNIEIRQYEIVSTKECDATGLRGR